MDLYTLFFLLILAGNQVLFLKDDFPPFCFGIFVLCGLVVWAFVVGITAKDVIFMLLLVEKCSFDGRRWVEYAELGLL